MTLGYHKGEEPPNNPDRFLSMLDVPSGHVILSLGVSDPVSTLGEGIVLHTGRVHLDGVTTLGVGGDVVSTLGVDGDGVEEVVV